MKYKSEHPLVVEFNNADDQCEFVKKVGREFTDIVKQYNINRQMDKKRYEYLGNLIKFFNEELKYNRHINEINMLNINDVIIDRRVDCKFPLPEKITKKYDNKVIESDYYIYIEGKIPKEIDISMGYKIYYMQKDFKGNKQYYEPHLINVKQNPIKLDETNLYPVIMVSDKYNFGNNHMDINQTLELYNTISKLI
jgi:hypothetical protein